MARSTREETEETREAILSSAKRLFETKGYARTKLTEICAAAGVTKGALFHHFNSKEALFTEIWTDLQTTMDRAAAREALQVGKSSDDPYAGFIEGCRVFLDYASDPKFQQIVNIDGPGVLGEAEWSRADAAMGLRNIGGGLRHLESLGLIDPKKRKPLTVLLYGALTGAAMELSRNPDSPSTKEILSAFETMLRNAR
ncbi:MAG: helix-turn-helix domain-containing protein [Pseudomonadota bacterium]